ncbi:hypothetical protein V6335_00700 [Serratia marcescens]|uniref:hypothetical protein n=1 Tax=Serratia marcescens TaxID=615 RepID=UPI003860DF9C
MDIKALLEAIRITSGKLDAAKRMIEICDTDFHKGGVYTDPLRGREVFLPIEKERIRELAIFQKQALEANLAVLEDAKQTAERIIAGLLTENKTSA